MDTFAYNVLSPEFHSKINKSSHVGTHLYSQYSELRGRVSSKPARDTHALIKQTNRSTKPLVVKLLVISSCCEFPVPPWPIDSSRRFQGICW